MIRPTPAGIATVAMLAGLLLVDPPLASGQSPASPGTALDVPYLPQTEDLCGGAAAAMLFRYFGERHADVQQFAPLVDRSAGGIADTDLIAAIRRQHWVAARLDGTVDVLRRELDAGRPPMLLIEDRPQRYHYVVAVQADADGVVVHDPAWGPSRRLTTEALEKAWKASGYWTLRVTPDPAFPPAARSRTASLTPQVTKSPDHDICTVLLDRALDDIQSAPPDARLARADLALSGVARECPESAGPLRELAGVRFAQKRWDQAADLASQALVRDPGDAYAAEVLASSRFMVNDMDGAIRAWNRVGRPQLDSVQIIGLSRTRYSQLAQGLGLTPNTMLGANAFRLARRRLESMPDLSSTRISVRPDTDGFAVADVAVVERPTLPRNVVQWAAAGAQSWLEREVSIALPGRTGQGETWSGSWGWWENRPRFSLQFAAPLLSRPRGVWRVSLSRDSQTYGRDRATELREERLDGQIGLSTWVNADVRAEINTGVDAWTRIDGSPHRTLWVGGVVERRLRGDRMSVQASAFQWIGMARAPGFGVVAVDAAYHSRRDSAPLVLIGRAGASTASSRAPLALWSGAGEGRSRAPLLRAHSLLDDGRIDGAVFGRTLVHATAEVQHWLSRPTLVRIGGAVFADTARAGGRPDFSAGGGFQLDVGAGLRVRVPGRSGVFRIDLAHGTRDGADAVLVGWALD